MTLVEAFAVRIIIMSAMVHNMTDFKLITLVVAKVLVEPIRLKINKRRVAFLTLDASISFGLIHHRYPNPPTF